MHFYFLSFDLYFNVKLTYAVLCSNSHRVYKAGLKIQTASFLNLCLPVTHLKL